MRPHAIRLAAVAFAACSLIVAAAAGPLPIPPVKAGLWEARMSALDANGQVMVPPEQAAMARMDPEARARMAEVLKARGLSMPDANGATKVCLSRDMFESGAWQQFATEAGCTTSFSTQTASTWKWHSSCTSLKAESDGEAIFANSENYQTKVTTTATVMGKTTVSSRVVQSKWLGADCGDVKPFLPPVRK